MTLLNVTMLNLTPHNRTQQMKHHLLTVPILATLLVSAAMAQTSEVAAANDLPQPVVAARCRYTPTEEPCVAVAATNQAQAPRRVPGPPLRRQPMPMGPRPSYPTMWREPGNGRHAAIGAVIGFGLGAAVGAKINKDQHPGVEARASLLFGTIGALIGAGVGYGTPSFHARNPHRYPYPYPENDEVASRSPSASPESTRADQPPPSAGAP